MKVHMQSKSPVTNQINIFNGLGVQSYIIGFYFILFQRILQFCSSLLFLVGMSQNVFELEELDAVNP